MFQKPSVSLSALLVLLGYITFYGCKSSHVEKPLRIALSSGSNNYINWIHRGDSLAEIVDLQGMEADSALVLLASCDGIVFTGGEDISPVYYGKESDSARCESNPRRDSLEFALIKSVMRMHIPVFGVCRGQQILNVALGGTLIVDIPSDHPGKIIHRCDDYLHCFHSVSIVEGSQVCNITRTDNDLVTTNHHQAVDKPAPGMRIVAWSADSIAEAMEWESPELKPFLITVQWHPERMNAKSPLSMPLVNAFLEAANAYRKENKKFISISD